MNTYDNDDLMDYGSEDINVIAENFLSVARNSTNLTLIWNGFNRLGQEDKSIVWQSLCGENEAPLLILLAPAYIDTMNGRTSSETSLQFWEPLVSNRNISYETIDAISQCVNSNNQVPDLKNAFSLHDSLLNQECNRLLLKRADPHIVHYQTILTMEALLLNKDIACTQIFASHLEDISFSDSDCILEFFEYISSSFSLKESFDQPTKDPLFEENFCVLLNCFTKTVETTQLLQNNFQQTGYISQLLEERISVLGKERLLNELQPIETSLLNRCPRKI